jgi:hypothetical protein
VCTTAFGGAGVTVWGCFSLNCKLDLYGSVAKTSVEGPSANASVDNASASQRVCSAEWPLSGEPFKESIFFWNRFQKTS